MISRSLTVRDREPLAELREEERDGAAEDVDVERARSRATGGCPASREEDRASLEVARAPATGDGLRDIVAVYSTYW